MRILGAILLWILLSAGYWYLFATAVIPLFGREGNGGHLLSFAMAVLVWVALSGSAWQVARRTAKAPE